MSGSYESNSTTSSFTEPAKTFQSLERMLRRKAEISPAGQVRLAINADNVNEDIHQYFVRDLLEILSTRAVRIEPEEWNPPPTVVVS